MRPILSLSVALLVVAPAHAQDDDGELPAAFSSDRPGFSSDTALAARGRLTTEIGAHVEVDDPAVAASLPGLSLRAGVLDWLEARVRAPDAVGVFDEPDATFGVSDPSVGFKIGGPLAQGLAISSVMEVSLPLGTDGFGAEEATFRADVQLDWEFWGPLSLIPNGVAAVLVTVDETGQLTRYVLGAGSLCLWWQIIDALGVYVQSFVVADELRDPRAAVGAGLGWMVAPNVQVDASFDVGVTDERIPPTFDAGATVLW